MKEREDVKVARRDFMKKTGFGVGVLGAAVVAAPKASRAVAGGSGEAPGKTGYRETEHVKRYYATARL